MGCIGEPEEVAKAEGLLVRAFSQRLVRKVEKQVNAEHGPIVKLVP